MGLGTGQERLIKEVLTWVVKNNRGILTYFLSWLLWWSFPNLPAQRDQDKFLLMLG